MSISPSTGPGLDPAATVDSPEPATYVRHRDRMVRESVYEDLTNTLIACRWMTGTTTRAVHTVEDGVLRVVSTTDTQVLRLLSTPLTVIEFFPETQDQSDPDKRVALNTLAMDTGRRGDSQEVELGSSLRQVEHIFNFAFYAEEDATASALFNDLADRYDGKLVNGDAVHLYNYNVEPPTLVSRMEVGQFRYTRDAERVAPEEVHLYFAELTLVDVS